MPIRTKSTIIKDSLKIEFQPLGQCIRHEQFDGSSTQNTKVSSTQLREKMKREIKENYLNS